MVFLTNIILDVREGKGQAFTSLHCSKNETILKLVCHKREGDNISFDPPTLHGIFVDSNLRAITVKKNGREEVIDWVSIASMEKL